MKKVFWLILLLLGCQKDLLSMSTLELKDKITNNEEYYVILTSKACIYCNNLISEISKSDITFYQIEVNDHNIKELQDVFIGLEEFPQYYHMIGDMIVDGGIGADLIAFRKWITKNN